MSDFQAGNTEALTVLLQRRKTWLYNVAKRTIADPTLVEDGFQEGTIQIFRSARAFRGESQVTSWMYQVMTRACIDVLRKEKVREHDYLPDDADVFLPSPSRFESQIHNQLLIRGALAELDPAHQEILQLIYMKELSYDEVSAKLEVPIGTVKSRIARASSKLKEVLKNINEQDGNIYDSQHALKTEVNNVRKLR